MIGRGPSQIDQSAVAAAVGPLATLASGAADQVLEMSPAGGATAPAWYTVAGDGAMSGGVFRLLAIGSSALGLLPVTVPIMQWVATAANPTIGQAAPAVNVAPTAIHVVPAPPNAASTTTASGTPAGFSVDLAAPVSTGNEAASQVTRNGVFVGSIRTEPAPNTGFASLYLSSSTVSAIHTNASQMQIGNNSATLYLAPSNIFMVQISAGNGIQLLAPATTLTFGGGVNVLGVTNCTTEPTGAAPTGGLALYSKAGGLRARGSGGATTQCCGPGQGTKNTHAALDLSDQGFCTTTSSASVNLYAWTVPTNTCGILRADLCARMVTVGTGGGGHVGDCTTQTISFGYSDVAGAITLTALASTAVQTIGSPGASTYAIAAAGNVITLSVVDSYGAGGAWSIDHQCNTHLSAA